MRLISMGVALSALVAFGQAGCDELGDQDTEGQALLPESDFATSDLEPGDNDFSPDGIFIFPGQAVRFRNLDTRDHTVTSGEADELNSAGRAFDFALAPGQEAAFEFNTVGVFPFFCRVHPEEEGAVSVGMLH